MDFPIEVILPPIVLVGVWLYWKMENGRRKAASLKGRKGVMEREDMQEMLSLEGKKLVRKESECDAGGRQGPPLRDWMP